MKKYRKIFACYPSLSSLESGWDEVKAVLTIAIFFIMLTASATSQTVFYNVKNFGAKADGKTLDGKAINKAIAVAANAGGGTVYFPAGNYFTGSIHLQSNVALYFDQGATIYAAPVSAANGYDEEEPGADNQYEDAGHQHYLSVFVVKKNEPLRTCLKPVVQTN